MKLETTYLGLKLKNPVIAASSGLTSTLNDLEDIERNGAGAIVLKSLFEEEIIWQMKKNQHKMSSQGFIFPETVDFFDYNEQDDPLGDYIRLIHEAKKKLAIPVIASINCVSAGNWTYFAKTIADAGADALELNMFVLPTDFSRSEDELQEVYFDVIRKVQHETNIPLSLKISYFSTNLGKFIQDLSKTGVKGLTLFNRFYSPDIDIQNEEIVSSNILSNPDEITIPLRWIGIMGNRVDTDLAASTGIHDSEALIKLLLAGADVVHLASTLYKNGYGQIEIMLEGLKAWMKEKNYTSIDDFRGKLSQVNTDNPAVYERVQFMKYFAGK